MSTKHTPGPWFQGTGDHQYCVYDKKVWINPDGSRGGETPNLVVVVSPEGALADARLIAAAPELLEALEGMIEVYGGACDSECLPKHSTELELIDLARTAIAKATGSTS